MRKLGWCFAAVVLLAGCAQAPDPSIQKKLATVVPADASYEMVRYQDNQYGVVCYRVRGFDGLSCVPYGALRPGVDRE